MERSFVSSSNLRSIGYDETLQVLEVEFNNGSVYQYRHVPEVIYLALMSASSQGQFFNHNIRNTFGYSRVS